MPVLAKNLSVRRHSLDQSRILNKPVSSWSLTVITVVMATRALVNYGGSTRGSN